MRSLRQEIWSGPRENLIERCCREAGWRIAGRDGDCYDLRLDDHRRRQTVHARYSEGSQDVPFYSWLPVRFPLDRPPSGLYARLLLRSFQAVYAAWMLEIAQSCEACLGVSARIPVAALDARLFDMVCRELLEEIYAFHQELRDKFRGDIGQVRPTSMTAEESGIIFIDESAPAGVPQHVRYRLPPR